MTPTQQDRPRVLVVDDDGDIRMALEMMLSYEGFEVWTAKDGREALARLGREAEAGQPADVVPVSYTHLTLPTMSTTW